MNNRYIDYQPIDRSSLFQPLIIGLGAGISTWLLTLLLDRFLLGPVLCTYSPQYCGSSLLVAFVVASLATHFIALVALVRTGALRPLLVILAAVVSVWGMHVWFTGMPWWLATLYSGLLCSLGYMYYAWINRLLFFPVALVLTIVSVIATRLIIALL